MSKQQKTFRFEHKVKKQLQKLTNDENTVYTSQNEVVRHAINNLFKKHYGKGNNLSKNNEG